MNRSEIIQELTDEYAERRRKNADEWAERFAYAGQLDPDIPPLLARTSNDLLAQAKALLKTPELAESRIGELRERVEARRAELKARLSDVNLPADYLDPIYSCLDCRDTGFIGEEAQTRCPCFEHALNARIYRSASAACISQNFESFDEAVFPDAPSGDPPTNQRSRMIAARDVCRRYADGFPNTDRRNIVLLGEIGLGKTFLLNCVASRVLGRGREARTLTAYQMFSAMRACHMNEEEGERRFRELIECPLLLLDDIGTEPLFNNITREYFFILLNERIANRRHTVVATNLSVLEIKTRYGERVMSRLFSREDAHIIRLTGQDLRLAQG